MKAHLLHPDRDFDLDAPLPAHAETLAQDIRIDIVIEAMADGDRRLRDIVRKVILSGETDAGVIAYRQDILRDCLDHPDAVGAIHALAAETLEREAKQLWHSADYGRVILASTIDVIEMMIGQFRRLKEAALAGESRFASRGLRSLCSRIGETLDDTTLDEMRDRLKGLNFGGGVLVSAALGPGNKGTDHVLRRDGKTPSLGERLFAGRRADTRTIETSDEAGARALSDIAEIGRDQVTWVLAEAAHHMLGFFRALDSDLAFYRGCFNLHARLARLGAATCFPTVDVSGRPALAFADLEDLSLRLSTAEEPVGNHLDADGRLLIVITGANQGGKSTFLRSLGIAQLMMQAGMFVAARSFRASPAGAVFTHFNREEDASMTSGKLDEEMKRLDAIADAIRPGDAILFNEPFASTNEREGAGIAEGIVRALIDREIRVVFVTHMSELARRLHEAGREDALFLEAERREGGARTFRLVESAPGRTGHGRDLYERIFGSKNHA